MYLMEGNFSTEKIGYMTIVFNNFIRTAYKDKHCDKKPFCVLDPLGMNLTKFNKSKPSGL